MTGRVIRARAPLRLGLGGGGTDVAPYSETHGGCVLNATIDLYAHVTLTSRSDGEVALIAADQQQTWRGPATPILPLADGLTLVKGVYNRMCATYNGGKALPVTVTTHADVPPGSGLGTSSALVVALVEAFRALLHVELGPYEVARLAFDIERIDLGLNGGKQDQYAATFGGLNFIEFGPGDAVLVNPLRIGPDALAEIESSLVLFFSGVSRESAGIIDQQSANVLSGDHETMEAMHALKRSAYAMKEAILRGHIVDFAHILDESYDHKKRTAANIVTSQTDRIYTAAKEAGAIGGKVSGAGGGGFMIFIVDPPRRPDVVRRLQAEEGQVFSCRFTPTGSHAWRASRLQASQLTARSAAA